MGSAAPLPIDAETEYGTVVFDGNAKMKSIKKVMKAASSGDIDTLIEGYSGLVISWPFDGKPSDPEAWDELGRAEFNAVVTSVAEGIAKAGEA